MKRLLVLALLLGTAIAFPQSDEVTLTTSSTVVRPSLILDSAAMRRVFMP